MFGVTTEEGWSPGIGDPTLGGWITVAAYLGAMGLAFHLGWSYQKTQPPRSLSRSALFWIFLGIFLLALGINKQLDLQTWFTEIGKKVAQNQGWYEKRRIVQAIFIILVAVIAAGSFFALLRLLKGNFRRHALALGGAFFILSFVVIRAGSFHHFDQLLGARVGGLKMNWILELGGIGLILAAAIREKCQLKGIK